MLLLLLALISSAAFAPVETGTPSKQTSDVQLKCMRQLEDGAQRVVVGGRVRAPQRVKHVAPVLPQGISGSGMWVGEALIGTSGKVEKTWTLRRPKVLPDSDVLDQAIERALMQWEYTPTSVDGRAVQVCMVVTMNIHWR